MEKTLASIYLDPGHPASYIGLDACLPSGQRGRKYNPSRKQVQDWLSQQDVCTLQKPACGHYKAQLKALLVDVIQ